jgi:hypothetical protein
LENNRNVEQEEAENKKAKKIVSVNMYITLQKTGLILKGIMGPTEVSYFYFTTEAEPQFETLTVY